MTLQLNNRRNRHCRWYFLTLKTVSHHPNMITNTEVDAKLRVDGLSATTAWLLKLPDEGASDAPQNLASSVKKLKAELACLWNSASKPGGQVTLLEYSRRLFRFPVPLDLPWQRKTPSKDLDATVLTEACEGLHQKTHQLIGETDTLVKTKEELHLKLLHWRRNCRRTVPCVRPLTGNGTTSRKPVAWQLTSSNPQHLT